MASQSFQPTLIAQVCESTTFSADSLAPQGTAVVMLDTSAVNPVWYPHPTSYLAAALHRRFSSPLHFIHLAVDKKSSRIAVVATSPIMLPPESRPSPTP